MTEYKRVGQDLWVCEIIECVAPPVVQVFLQRDTVCYSGTFFDRNKNNSCVGLLSFSRDRENFDESNDLSASW